ncbi:MAG TPA: hypothetical protein VD998_00505, partial [Verrucomicrobiae bacterium]|nr:hypothetical protein [Verrucomicrobiae bacterium]
MATIIKLDKNEEIAQVIQRIKNLRERDVVFEVDKGSVILTNSANLRLMRKTAEVLGKNIQLKTDDEMGQVLANKAGLPLFGQKQAKVPKTVRPVSKQPATKTSKPRFSDIKAKSRVKPAPAAQQVSDEEVEFTQPDLQDDIVVPMPNPPASIKKATVTPRPVIPPVTIPRSTPGPKASTPSRWKFGRDYSKVFILTAIILVVAVFGLAVLLPKAEITVYARSEPVTRDLEISVDRNAKGIDHTKLIIPGEVITKELSHTKTFQTSGIKKVGEKATGSVVIYNFTKNTLTLRASTTTLLINGKKYFFTRDATGIRPTATIGSGNDQEVDRTSLTAPVPIIADQAGEEYNLPVNQKIQIQNTALGDNPSVYAMNEVAFTGGSAKNVPILSQADIDRATQQMTDELATIAEDEVST